MRWTRKLGLALVAFFVIQIAVAQSSSSYLIGKFYGVALQGTSYTPPATVYVALATGTFTPQACTTEVSGGAYARVAITSNTSNWTVSSGSISNNVAITFPAPTANWGTVNQFCFYDASTGGNLLVSAQLNISQAIKTVGVFTIPVTLHPEVKINITVNVARSEDEAAALARGEDVLAAKTDQEEAAAAAEDIFEAGAGPKEGGEDQPAEG